MRIRSLEITGFKSFADRVTLGFDRGISAIVGPNGCGKSNVVDAIRWVMGEQNPRHLRGRLMDDIIFAGTETRPAVGMAEVVLVLDASDGRVPPEYADFSEIQIARRLYRSGESEYLINRVPCRLRDVTDFFLDTGVGTHGYTIVEQGQIVSIVSTRPEDRRFIIEEAAGIGKYRQRRRETERKLDATEQNLLRVSDVLGELKRRISSLDRQARKATRYKELSARVRDLELSVAHEQLQSHAERLEEAEREHEELRTEGVALDARVARADSQLEAQRRGHLGREKQLQESSERLYALRNEIQALESRIDYERREREGLLAQAMQREEEAVELEQQLASDRTSLNETVEELSFVADRLGREQAQLQARGESLREQTENVAGLQGRREALQAQLVELSAEEATIRSRIEAIEERRRELEARLRREEEVIESDTVQVEALAVEEHSLEDRLREAMAEQDELGRHLAEVLRTRQERERRLEELQSALSEARSELQQLIARLEALREAEQAESARIAEAMDRIPEVQRRAVRGILSDVVRVDQGLERALEVSLGRPLEAILVDDPQAALALLRWLRSAEAGRATVLAADPTPVAISTGLVPLGRPLLDSVRVKPPFEALVRKLLADVYVVDDIGEAVERYGVSSPPATFVTRSGELLDRAGAMTGGTAAPAGALSRAGDIRALEARIEERDAERARLERLVLEEREQAQSVGRDLENTRSRRHTAELAVVHVEKDLERTRERGKEMAEAAEEHRVDKASLISERERAESERVQAESRLDAIAGERSQAERDRNALAVRIGELAREIERVEQRQVQQKVELAELGAREAQLRAARERLDRSQEEGSNRLARRRSEISAARERAEALSHSVVEVSDRLSEQIREEESARISQDSMRSTYEEGARAMEEAEGEQRAAARERESLHERLAAAELALQQVRMQRDQLLERIRERYGVDLERYALDAPVGGDPEQRAADLERLRQSLDALGDVHLGAIEEYEEVSERFRYLSEQKADLEVSVERLRNAIARINRTSRARFRETFDAVNAEFKKTYPRLFKGGRAHLSLTEAEDVLEAGIEITAQPPGKKLQNVNLLSGGEKSLTAIALLLAVFQVKPSPFFLLDEVDAALDDANVGRFNDMVREVAANSQLLMITHNKGSIEIADKLFGVTMQTPGLSKLVTVDLVS